MFITSDISYLESFFVENRESRVRNQEFFMRHCEERSNLYLGRAGLHCVSANRGLLRSSQLRAVNLPAFIVLTPDSCFLILFNDNGKRHYIS